VLTDFGADVLSTSNDNGSFSTSWLRNLSAASDSWRRSSKNTKKLHINDFDNFHYHAQPSPVPAPILQLAGSAYLLRATAWEHYGRYISIFCECQGSVFIVVCHTEFSRLYSVVLWKKGGLDKLQTSVLQLRKSRYLMNNLKALDSLWALLIHILSGTRNYQS